MHNRSVKLGWQPEEKSPEIEKTRNILEIGFEFDFIIGMNGGMIYDRNLDKTFTMDMMSIEEMKVLTFLMPIIEENKVSINVEEINFTQHMNISEDLLDMSKRRNVPLIDKTGDIDGL